MTLHETHDDSVVPIDGEPSAPWSAPIEVPRVPPVDRHSTAREVIRFGIARSVSNLIDHLQGTVSGTDAEALHQARVATRRMRSDLRTFGPLLDLDWTSRLRDELRWIGSSLGEVRDLDVLLEVLDGLVDDEPSLSPDSVAALRSMFVRSRDERRDVLLADLGSARFAQLLTDLAEAARDPRTAPPGRRPRRRGPPRAGPATMATARTFRREAGQAPTRSSTACHPDHGEAVPVRRRGGCSGRRLSGTTVRCCHGRHPDLPGRPQRLGGHRWPPPRRGGGRPRGRIRGRHAERHARRTRRALPHRLPTDLEARVAPVPAQMVVNRR
jgi:hypothetical protein